MYRGILTALTAGAMLVAFAALPPMPGSSTLSLSGSALAQKKDPKTDSLNLNTSRSNIYRMGGGGGRNVSSGRVHGGGGGGGNARATGGKPPCNPLLWLQC
jgi:hypothetical protein